MSGLLQGIIGPAIGGLISGGIGYLAATVSWKRQQKQYKDERQKEAEESRRELLREKTEELHLTLSQFVGGLPALAVHLRLGRTDPSAAIRAMYGYNDQLSKTSLYCHRYLPPGLNKELNILPQLHDVHTRLTALSLVAVSADDAAFAAQANQWTEAATRIGAQMSLALDRIARLYTTP